MSIRQRLNEHAGISAAITVVILILAAAFAMQYRRAKKPSSPPLPAQLFFSDDDGETFFPDDAAKAPPFIDLKGKEAYRAAVYRCPDGKTFVGHLETFDPAERQEFVAAVNAGANPVELAIKAQTLPFPGGMKIKRPHDKEWVKLQAHDPKSIRRFTDIINSACPGSGERGRPVLPGD